MSLTTDSIFAQLATATFGVYAVSLDETIVFWNQAAERILGYSSDEAIGRRCHELFSGLDLAGGHQEDHRHECPSITALQAGRLPSQTQMHIVCSSGDRKLVSMTPIIVGGVGGQAELVLHLFTDAATGTSPDVESDARQTEPAGSVSAAASSRSATGGGGSNAPRLTSRELEVLRLVAMGWDTPRIAHELNISPHTVLNHIRHFRRKLDAPTKLDAVVSAIRLRILPID